MTRISAISLTGFAMTALAITGVGAQRADTTVRMATRPIHAGVATLVPELKIGNLDGPDEYVFGDIAEIAVARDGSIYVFDRQVPALRQYDANGKYVRTLGAKGSGPGEYRSGGGLAIHPDGRVLLWDTGNWRVNVYSATGAFLTSWLTPSGAAGDASMMTSKALLVDSAGAVYFRKPDFSMRRTPGAPRIDRWVKFSRDGAPLDTIDVPQPSTPDPRVSAVSGQASQSAPVPFAAPFIHVLSPHGYFVTAQPAAYAFELREPGKPVVSVRRDVALTPVSNRERDSARKAVEESMRRLDPVWNWNGPDIPRTKAPFSRLYVGADGRIWIPLIPEVGPVVGGISGNFGVGRAGGGRGPAPNQTPAKPTPALYDVFEPNGTYVGQVEVPPRVSTVVRRGDFVWGVEYGEDDVPFVRRFKIVWK